MLGLGYEQESASLQLLAAHSACCGVMGGSGPEGGAAAPGDDEAPAVVQPHARAGLDGLHMQVAPKRGDCALPYGEGRPASLARSVHTSQAAVTGVQCCCPASP